MAAEINLHRYGTEMQHCQAMYTDADGVWRATLRYDNLTIILR